MITMCQYFTKSCLQKWSAGTAGFVAVAFMAGCYIDRLPEEVSFLGVPRVTAIEFEPIPLVTLRPTETVKVPLRINRNNNEGPIDVSLSKLPSGVEATFEKQIPQGKQNLRLNFLVIRHSVISNEMSPLR